MKMIGVKLCALMLLGAIAAAQAGGLDQPVMVGGEADYDACGATGDVHNLNPAGDNFLAVRSGPGTGHDMIDKLHTGDPLFICDEQGSWIGIVYDDGDLNCEVGSPIAQRQPYKGNCRSGWVHKKYVRFLAG